jgi:hypothetical protein
MKKSRGSGYLFLRGSTWWAQYYDRGKRFRFSCETQDEKKAQKFLRVKVGQVDNGIHPDPARTTYEELREAFYADYVDQRRKSLRRDAEGRPRLDKVVRLDGFFAGYRATDIDTDLLRKYIADQQTKVSNATINRSLSALRRMLQYRPEGRENPNSSLLPVAQRGGSAGRLY